MKTGPLLEYDQVLGWIKMAYALGKFAIALCDRCSFEYKLSELKEEWTGFKVCSECY